MSAPRKQCLCLGGKCTACVQRARWRHYYAAHADQRRERAREGMRAHRARGGKPSPGWKDRPEDAIDAMLDARAMAMLQQEGLR
jgi:hypothetical protein